MLCPEREAALRKKIRQLEKQIARDAQQQQEQQQLLQDTNDNASRSSKLTSLVTTRTTTSSTNVGKSKKDVVFGSEKNEISSQDQSLSSFSKSATWNASSNKVPVRKNNNNNNRNGKIEKDDEEEEEEKDVDEKKKKQTNVVGCPATPAVDDNCGAFDFCSDDEEEQQRFQALKGRLRFDNCEDDDDEVEDVVEK